MVGILEGKSALVTGGGGGIGRVAALAFTREGANVAVADLIAEAAEETVALVNPRRRSGNVPDRRHNEWRSGAGYDRLRGRRVWPPGLCLQ